METVADAEEEAAVGMVLLQGVAEDALGFELREAATHERGLRRLRRGSAQVLSELGMNVENIVNTVRSLG